MNCYQVDVYIRGQLVASHRVEALDGLLAINLVETNYGEPPQVEHKTVQHEDGTKETALVVTGWHGYSFEVRRIEPV